MASAASGGRYDLLSSPTTSGTESPAVHFDFRTAGRVRTSTDTPSTQSGTPTSSNGISTPVFFTGPVEFATDAVNGNPTLKDTLPAATSASTALPAVSAPRLAAAAAGGTAAVETPATPQEGKDKSSRRLSFLDIPDGGGASAARVAGAIDDSVAYSKGSRRAPSTDISTSRERHRRSRSLPPQRGRRPTVVPHAHAKTDGKEDRPASPAGTSVTGGDSGSSLYWLSVAASAATAAAAAVAAAGGRASSTATPVQSPARTPGSAAAVAAMSASHARAAKLSTSWYLSGELGLNLTSDRRHKPDNYKRERVYNTVFRLPYRLEQMLAFAVFLCFDSLLAMPTCLPMRTASLAYRLLRHNSARLLSFLRRRHRRDSTTQRLEVLAHNVTDQLLVDALWVSVVGATCWWIWDQDVSALYHVIRGQEVVKMYVLFSVLQISDALLGSFGADMLEALNCSAARVLTDERRAPALCALLLDFALLLAASLAHTACLLAQAITLMSAMNSRSNALLALLVSANFSEVKGYVFKRMDATKIGQLACQDAIERVHMFLCLGFVISQHLLHTHSGQSSVPVLLEACVIFLCEVAVDVLKHAFMAKFNDIRPDTYKDVLRDLARRTLRVHSHQAHLVLGFVPIAPLALAIRAAPPILTVVLGMRPTVLQFAFIYSLLWAVKIPSGVMVHKLAKGILGEKTDWSAATRVGGSGLVATPKFYGAVREQPPRPPEHQGAGAGVGAAGVGGGLPLASAAGQPGWGLGQRLAFHGSLPSPKRSNVAAAAEGGAAAQNKSQDGGSRNESAAELRRRSVGLMLQAASGSASGGEEPHSVAQGGGSRRSGSGGSAASGRRGLLSTDLSNAGGDSDRRRSGGGGVLDSSSLRQGQGTKKGV